VKVPLDLVHKEWKLHLGKSHLQRVGLHSHIYQDIFGTLFMPQGFMRVVYRAGGRDGKEVHWGNIISAEEVHTTYSVQDKSAKFSRNAHTTGI